MNDAFAVIHWQANGLSSGTIGFLWSEAVASEAIVFLFVGPLALARFGVARCAVLAAVAGMVQWGTLATTTSPPLLALTQPMQGLTFGLTHLVTMRVIMGVVRPSVAATAQALYGTFALGLASAVFTMLSGLIYEAFAGRGFLGDGCPLRCCDTFRIETGRRSAMGIGFMKSGRRSHPLRSARPPCGRVATSPSDA